MTTITRRLTFETGHRVFGHEGKCANPHGHSYKLEIEATADTLDAIGRVIDFSVLKEKVGGWIDRFWDHGFIYFTGDAKMFQALHLTGGKRFPLSANPTAENMAYYLLHVVCPQVLKDTGVRVTRVTLHETENCKAEVAL